LLYFFLLGVLTFVASPVVSLTCAFGKTVDIDRQQRTDIYQYKSATQGMIIKLYSTAHKKFAVQSNVKNKC